MRTKSFCTPSVAQGQETPLGPQLPNLPTQCLPQGKTHLSCLVNQVRCKKVMQFTLDVLSSFFVSCEDIICKLCKIMFLANSNMHPFNKLCAAACCNRCLVNVLSVKLSNVKRNIQGVSEKILLESIHKSKMNKKQIQIFHDHFICCQFILDLFVHNFRK